MDGNRKKEEEESGWVFNIQRYAVHDGPGIRTTVFLKGCPLYCLWCDNPESHQIEPQIVFWEDRCIHCGACLSACLRSAIHEDNHGDKQVDLPRCDFCGACIGQCYADALEQVGELKSVSEVLAIVEEDQPFYDESGGGMTLSGGEPLAQPEFTRSLLQGARACGIHTAIETCGYAPWPVWESLLPFLDLILYDLKETDAMPHEDYTGVSNELILENLRRLSASGIPVIVRRPVIPGYNDNAQSIHALGRFVQGLGKIDEIDLLPYHRLGQKKYQRLGQEYVLGDTPTMKEEEVIEFRDILHSYGLEVKIGG